MKQQQQQMGIPVKIAMLSCFNCGLPYY